MTEPQKERKNLLERRRGRGWNPGFPFFFFVPLRLCGLASLREIAHAVPCGLWFVLLLN